MRLYRIDLHPQRVKEIFKNIGVDKRAWHLMYPKSQVYTFLVKGVPAFIGNILKQEMLSLGADAAVPRQALMEPFKKIDLLLIGTLKHYEYLFKKLKDQPLILVRELVSSLKENIDLSPLRLWKAGRYTLDLKKPIMMGILNLTPDSFSGDGLLKEAGGSAKKIVSIALKRTEYLIRAGCKIIDIGAESTRPGAKSVSGKEELKRLMGVLKGILKRFNIPVSVDTYKPSVAKAVLDEGASIINDIKGLRDKKMLQVLSKSNAGAVIMHMKGTPRTMQKNPYYQDLIPDIIDFLRKRIKDAQDNGIKRERLVVDPGIGFGKTPQDNYKILRYIEEFQVLKRPVLLGVSRKSFLGYILKNEVSQRLIGTVASCCWAVSKGVKILRVHDPKEISQALKIMQAINDA